MNHDVRAHRQSTPTGPVISNLSIRSLAAVVLALVGAVFAACSGGSGPARLNVPNCTGASKFCLTSCNLGCSVSGVCAVSEIAQNQPIVLQFSEPVMLESVSPATVSLKTSTGETPAGSFFVDGATIRFQPEVRFTGGLTTFGFRAGETYLLNLPAAASSGQVLRAESGDPLSLSINCTMSVTQGLVDLDGQAPIASLELPSTTTDVAKDSPIVVRFSELIDIAPFQGGGTINSPIVYQLRKVLRRNGVVSCDPDFEPILLEGVPIASIDPATQETSVTLVPAIPLPRDICVEILVTDRVRDLAGIPARPRTFRFFTVVGQPEPGVVTEDFTSALRLDRSISAADWVGGNAIARAVGGFGLHGSFEPGVGREVAPNVFEWSTDDQAIPGSRTLLGEALRVTDGRFEFTDFVVPSGVTVQFRGNNPAIIRVRGQVSIAGEVNFDGSSGNPGYDGRSVLQGTTWLSNPGEAGARGGPGAGRGGAGAESCRGTGPTSRTNGERGQDAIAPVTSGYAGRLAATGGGGGLLFPASGLHASVQYNLSNFFAGHVAGGGGGGALFGAGAAGRVVEVFSRNPNDIGPDSQGGAATQYVARPGTAPLDHFLVGGAGGGGGGSQPVNMTSTEIISQRRPWVGGAGGSGGGGACLFVVGGSLTVESSGVIASRGGGGNRYTNFRDKGPPSPGGAGSGGSVVLMVAGTARQRGTLDVSGGPENQLIHPQFNMFNVDTRGGAGGFGYVRLEGPLTPSVSALGTVLGPTSLDATNVGRLSDVDDQVGFASLYYSTRQVFAPRFLHYVVRARIGNTDVVFSDDPTRFNPANQPGAPLRVLFQGALVNPSTNQPEGTPGPWRDFVNGDGPRAGASINQDGATGFRFMMLVDRTVESQVRVQSVEVFFET